MPGGWTNCDPDGYAGLTIPFSQTDEFPWMSMSELTKGGCCLAMTIRFFDHYYAGTNIPDYFTWLTSTAGSKDIMNTQSFYINHAKSGGAIFSALKAVARIAEGDKLVSLGYTKVHSPYFPTIDFSEFPAEAMREFNGEPRVFKMIYFSDLKDGTAHAMGIILDNNNGAFMLFDPNEGLAQFGRKDKMREWLTKVYPEYDAAWSGYYLDTWRR